MIGLIAAEKTEVGNLIKSLKAKIIEFNGFRFYVGQIANSPIVICFSGVGKVNAAAAAMNMVINFGVDKIINIGLCGACKLDVKPGDVLIANAVANYDVDLTGFGYALNQMPDEPIAYEIKSQYYDYLKSIIMNAHVGTIASGDSVVTINNVEAFPALANKEVIGFDMEAVAIAQICYKSRTDFMCIKVVSDNLTLDEASRKQYDSNMKTLSNQIEKISLKVLEKYAKE